ncbi:MAG: pyridoxal phosphate-dependent aminotransferase [Candidatus Poribacteria bacterium]|nr:pyridoxal phosphate-dependent aminotransferase [Candidatus Poribacteria bacterium]
MPFRKPLSQGTSRMPISGIRHIMGLASEIPDAIHLEVGQPDFRTPQHIIDAAHQAALDGYTAYTPNAGLTSLREMCARKVQERNVIAADVDNILITVGSEGAVASTFVALVDPGDEVLVPEPGWTNYTMLTHARGAVPVSYHLREDEDFLPQPDEIESHITPQTKLLIINTPANPTGSVYPESTVRAIVELANRYGLYILSDEAYESLIFEGKHVSPARFDTEGRVVTAFSFSKSYAMTGWRVGFAVAPIEIARLMIQLQEPYYSCAPSVSQKAAEAALSGSQACVEEMAAAYKRRQRAVLDTLKPDGFVAYQPNGAFYVLMNIASTGMKSYDFATQCLLETHVAVAPGATFGDAADPYIRISVATNDDAVIEGAKRLRDYAMSKSEG